MEMLEHLYGAAYRYARINPCTSRSCLQTFCEVAKRSGIEIDSDVAEGFCPACFSFYDGNVVLRVRGKRKRTGRKEREEREKKKGSGKEEEEEEEEEGEKDERGEKMMDSGDGKRKRRAGSKGEELAEEEGGGAPGPGAKQPFPQCGKRQVHYFKAKDKLGSPLHLNKQCGTCGAVVRRPIPPSPPNIFQSPQLVSICDGAVIGQSKAGVKGGGGGGSGTKSRLGSAVLSAAEVATLTRPSPSPSQQGKSKQRQQQQRNPKPHQQGSGGKNKKRAGDIARMLKNQQAARTPTAEASFSLNDFISSL